MKRLTLLRSLLVFILLLFGCGKTDKNGEGYSKIVDGDTFITERGIEVRLIGIDTPETGERYSIEAAKMLKRLLDTGQVKLEYDIQRFDKYGRTLAYVHAGSLMVNKALLDSGMAVAYFHEPNLKYFNQFVQAQHNSRISGLNIWSLPPVSLCEFYFSTKNSFRFHRPDCPSVRNRDVSSLRKFSSRGDALDAGLSPCRNCKP
ncbi:MAG: hypothetical protein GF307_04500 [candidate division Zixibacteria bacterium]|nr:hypothetical protein [candidate division Zixibacteria bacterium]